jgi:intracellular multiplication protein IcmK
VKKIFFSTLTTLILCAAVGVAWGAISLNNSALQLPAPEQALSPAKLPSPAAVPRLHLAANTPAVNAAPSALLTGSEGDAGDPNNTSVANAVVAAQTAPTTTSTPASAIVTPMATSDYLPATTTDTATPPAPTATTAAPVSASAFGSTTSGRTAFTQVLRNLMPLDPQQIITLRNMFDRSQRAVAQYPGVPPKPTSSSILVNMSPGAAPPVIRLRAGYVTSLVFLDSTGQPWPVTGYDLGNPKAFNIQPNVPNGKSNTLIVQATDRYEEGNLAIMLKDENTPVMLTLMTGQRAVDYRVDLRMPGVGPNGVVAVNGLPQTESPMLVNFLDGVAPHGAKAMAVRGAPAQAWTYQGHLFVRTRVTILSPGWISSMSSPDGTHVYELPKTPVILASQRGATLQLSIRGL